MFILATLHSSSKVTLQQQRTHASYTSLGTQTCRAVNTSFYWNPISILPIKTCV